MSSFKAQKRFWYEFVTLDEIARLSLVKKTLDAADIPDAEQIENILRAIRQMDDILTLYDNDQYVIPKIPENRTTLIIRDLPEDVKIEEIKTLLNNDVKYNLFYRKIQFSILKSEALHPI